MQRHNHKKDRTMTLASQVIDFPRAQTEKTGPFLAFVNDGVLEIELVKLLGVSVKETEDPIGFFGTGLKYALATALRLGGSVTIITGGMRYEVTGKDITLRDKQFTQVMLNDEPLGFTTELGKQWEAWMVVRELYSNALDENGVTSIANGDPEDFVSSGRTMIALHGKPFLDVWHERDRYFIDFARDRVAVKTQYLEAYESRQRSVFYRGIKIHETQFPTIFKYNLSEKVTLTEDRTLKYVHTLDDILEKNIIGSTDADFIRRSLTSGDTTHEAQLDFDGHYFGVELSDQFKAVCADLLIRMPSNVNRKAIRFYQNRTNTEQDLSPCAITKVQQMQLDKAVAFVTKLGCSHLDFYPVTVVRWIGQGIHGLAKDGRIYIGAECFDKGTKYVASTLYEEYTHCHYGFDDQSLAMQLHLFDKIITLGEEINGEPL